MIRFASRFLIIGYTRAGENKAGADVFSDVRTLTMNRGPERSHELNCKIGKGHVQGFLVTAPRTTVPRTHIVCKHHAEYSRSQPAKWL